MGTGTAFQGEVIDATGLACPLPILALAKAARQAPQGAVLMLLATDPAVEPDLDAWCQATGNELVALTREGKHWRALVRKVGL
ncbi:MAG: sulfurtransferase TusA family protein [Myxococcota bacterium]